MSTLPSFFISHGSPMIALEPDASTRFLEVLGRTLPRPRAIVLVSAHHMTRGVEVGTSTSPETIHDFGGFPPPLYRMRYPARGAADIADRVVHVLEAGRWTVARNPRRGLDHGAWVPLRYLYPAADVPVVPVSIQPEQDAHHHFELGQALAPLRHEGVLVMGSGNLTHNLYEIDRAGDARPAPYVVAFQRWFLDRFAAGETDALLEWATRAPEAMRAHPSDEHLLPLFVALGAGGEGARVRRLHDVVANGVLAMDAYAFGSDEAALDALAAAMDEREQGAGQVR